MDRPSVLFRRLDAPGHDACRLEPHDGGWLLAGTAVFLEEGQAARLDYRVIADSTWRTRSGKVQGFVGSRDLVWDIERSADGVWTLNGSVVQGLGDCLDLDLGFTPATNLLQLRRVDLAVGDAADVPVAWIDVASPALERMEQRYTRRGDALYFYESPRFGYRELLEILPSGFVRTYPGLWVAE